MYKFNVVVYNMLKNTCRIYIYRFERLLGKANYNLETLSVIINIGHKTVVKHVDITPLFSTDVKEMNMRIVNMILDMLKDMNMKDEM